MPVTAGADKSGCLLSDEAGCADSSWLDDGVVLVCAGAAASLLDAARAMFVCADGAACWAGESTSPLACMTADGCCCPASLPGSSRGSETVIA